MIRIQTLGTSVIVTAASRVTPNSAMKFATLLRLAVEPGRRISRSALRELIFPDQTRRKAFHSIRQLVYQFRRLGVFIDSNEDGLALESEKVEIDYAEIVATGRIGLEQLKAVEGGFLPGYAPNHSEAFSAWLDEYRSRTTFELCKALAKEVLRAQGIADWETMERLSRACLAFDPWHEGATFGLAEVLVLAGAKSQAVAFLDRYIKEVGDGSRDLKVTAALRRRRIGERISAPYNSRFVSPFVGRSPQMLDLRDKFERARDGQSHCVALVGEAGIGKSRLASEFCWVAGLEGAEVVSAGCQPNDIHRPFSIFADLAPRLIEMRGALGCAPNSLKAIERLIKSPSAEAVPFDEAIRDSEVMCDSIAHALVDVIDAISSEQPLLLSIEDLHWSDKMTPRVLAALLSRRGSRRLFVLVTSREAEAINAISRYADGVSVLELRGLDADAVDRITAKFAKQHETVLDDELRGWVGRTSAGNPLYLESLVTHYLNTKERFAIPPTLTLLLQRRIGILQPSSVTTLQICALLGKHATMETIIAATELPRYELLRAVAELENARLVAADGEQIRTAHALIGDVAIASLTPMQAQLGHKSVAEALGALLNKSVSTSLAWDCADHWVAANHVGRAVESLRSCAARATEIGRPADAANILSRALSLDLQVDDRSLVAWTTAVAADAAGDYSLALAALDLCTAPPDTAPLDSLELLRLRALMATRLGSDASVEQLSSCVECVTVDPTHRLAVGCVLLKHADLSMNSELKQRVVDALPAAVVSRASAFERLEFQLIRSAVCLEWEETISTARSIVSATATASVASRLRLQGNAFVALDLAGLPREAVEIAKQNFYEAESAGARRWSLRSALYLSDTLLDLREDDESSRWDLTIKRLIDEVPTFKEDFQLLLIELVRACTFGRKETTVRLFERAESFGLFSGSAPRERSRFVFAAWFTLSCGSIPSDGVIGRLVRNALDPFSSGCPRDFECGVACSALLRSDRLGEAREVMRRYTIARGRATGRLSRFLQDVKATLAQANASRIPRQGAAVQNKWPRRTVFDALATPAWIYLHHLSRPKEERL